MKAMDEVGIKQAALSQMRTDHDGGWAGR